MKLTYIGESILYDVTITAITPNIVQALGNSLIPRESGFMLTDNDGNEYDYSMYKTIYRPVEGGYQFSNDGEIWVEPTTTVTVQIVWNDSDDVKGIRPSSVKVSVFDNETPIGTVTLNAKNNWTKVYENVPESHLYTVTAPDYDGYDQNIVDTTIYYSYKQAYEPTVEEQLEEITDMLIDLDERVHALEEG